MYIIKTITSIAILALLVTSCKPTASPDTKESTAPKATEADLGMLYQYYHASPSSLEQRDENTLIEYMAEQGLTPERTRSGVYIIHKSKPSKDLIKWGERLSVDYKGYFLDGEIFDSSYKRGKPLKFRVGQMIPGWNEALLSLSRGSKATLLIPSHLAYGKRGMGKIVPADANLAFDIEILDEN